MLFVRQSRLRLDFEIFVDYECQIEFVYRGRVQLKRRELLVLIQQTEPFVLPQFEVDE